jgi:hypothetical protein
MPEEGLGERHRRLLRAIDEAARRDADGVATMYRAAEGVGLNPVVSQADREEFVGLVRDLQEAGYVEVIGVTRTGMRASYSATEEGQRLLEEPRESPVSSGPSEETPTGEPGGPREEPPERRSWWSRIFGG